MFDLTMFLNTGLLIFFSQIKKKVSHLAGGDKG